MSLPVVIGVVIFEVAREFQHRFVISYSILLLQACCSRNSEEICEKWKEKTNDDGTKAGHDAVRTIEQIRDDATS